MEQPTEYKGYEVVSIQNKKIVAQIKNNLHVSEKRGDFGNKLMHEPPIRFVGSYESIIKFIDQNPR